jgi:hypothetical protein
MAENESYGKNCDVCGDPAEYECWGGPAMQSAGQAGAVMDRPFPQNKVYRCKKHKENKAIFGHLWQWRKMK